MHCLLTRFTVTAVWMLWPLLGDASAVVIDGRFDEAEWLQARAYTAFRTTQPPSFDEPPHSTRARVLATPVGLAVAIECTQPEEQRVRGRSPRDTLLMDADAVSVFVDFEGSGSTAYEFTVSLSGSVRDGVVVQQNRRQYTWDGVWYSAAAETDVGWQVELLLPWSTAPMGVVSNEQRRIGVFVGRESRASAQVYSYPALVLQSPSFVADFQKVEIPAFEAAPLDLTPYGALSHDLFVDRTSVRGGVDINWRPTAQQQLTATVKPDFGQIESDDLVVNFSAFETFRPDKRPFFTQNHELFDLRVAQTDRLIHTRRIGAAPDVGPRSSTELLGAAKYVWNAADWELGAFAAVEDDSTLSQGRTFVAARSRWKAEQWSLGYLGTHVDRPSLQRQVDVHAVDAEWLPAAGWRLTSQLVTTRPSQPRISEHGSSEPGHAALAMLEYAGAAPFTNALWLKWYDERYDTNDMGFMERNDLREMLAETRWYRRLQYPASSRLQEMHWIFAARVATNALDERLPSWFRIGPFWQYRDGSSLSVYVQPTSSGIDDLNARNDSSFVSPPQHSANAVFRSNPSRAFQYSHQLDAYREGLERYGWRLQFKPAWWLNENLKLSAVLTYTHGPAWLIWRPEIDRMASHERSLLQTAVSAEWFPSVRSEIRAKLQWSALRARGGAAYDIDASNQLIRSDVVPPDFSHSELALQIRFRYQLRPMSDLYIAYSWGGLASESDRNHFGPLWDAALQGRSAQELMIKLTYRL